MLPRNPASVAACGKANGSIKSSIYVSKVSTRPSNKATTTTRILLRVISSLLPPQNHHLQVLVKNVVLLDLYPQTLPTTTTTTLPQTPIPSILLSPRIILIILQIIIVASLKVLLQQLPIVTGEPSLVGIFVDLHPPILTTAIKSPRNTPPAILISLLPQTAREDIMVIEHE